MSSCPSVFILECRRASASRISDTVDGGGLHSSLRVAPVVFGSKSNLRTIGREMSGGRRLLSVATFYSLYLHASFWGRRSSRAFNFTPDAWPGGTKVREKKKMQF